MSKLCVINASDFQNPALDQRTDFSLYSSYEDGKWRSWRSIAAAERADFFVYGCSDFSKCFKYDAFLILLNSELNKIVPFLEKLKFLKKKIILAYHECAHITDNESLDTIFYLKYLVDKYAFAFWNVNTPFHNFWESLFSKNVRIITIPTMSPFNLWDTSSFALSFEEKNGILIGTRSLNQSRLKRDTLKALLIAKEAAQALGCHISYINEDGEFAAPFLNKLMEGSDFRILPYQFDYFSWVKVINQHRLVYQADNSNSLGQVITDAALVNTLCVGGNCDYSIEAKVDQLNTTYALNDVVRYYEEKELYEEKLKRIKKFNFAMLHNMIREHI